MDPLFGKNDAMTLALQTYAKTAQFGPPDELNMDVGGSRGLFTTGRCALTMDWGDIGTLAPGTYAQDKTGATITPGWKQVLDRATGKLVPCDATTCPNADRRRELRAVRIVRWLVGRRQREGSHGAAGRRVRLPVVHERAGPVRRRRDPRARPATTPIAPPSSSNTAPWLAAGLSQAATDNYLGAIKASLENKNFVLDLRIPQTKQYEQDVLDTAIAQYLAKELDEAGTEQAITDGWNAITDQVGKDKQLAAYVASLGIKK